MDTARPHIPELVRDPADGQTERTIGAYLRRCGVGDSVAIHETHAGVLRFVLTTIKDIAPRKGRLYTVDDGVSGNAWYIRTGRSCWFPTGQSHLVESSGEIREFVERFGTAGTWLIASRAHLYGTD